VALSGGSTPKSFYLQLNHQPLPWDKIEFWIGDERCVPSDDPLSNQRMISETLLVGRRETVCFHPWNTTLAPETAVAEYEKELHGRAGNPPVMDLIFLGIGADGHVASLFPGSSVLQESERSTGVCRMPGLNPTRLTFTFPVLNTARQIWFMVQGKDKATIVNRLIQGGADFPAGRIQNSHQKLYWLPE
jgi:6-phosphogluconolactonase